MAYEPKANSGSLFINDRKATETQPDLRGSIHVSRELIDILVAKDTPFVEISISAWNKTSAKGTTFLSLAASAPYVKPQEQEDKIPY